MVSAVYMLCIIQRSLTIFHFVVLSFGINVGTERCNEALQKLGKQYDVVVNIQGDEPLIEPEIIDGIVKALQVKWSSFLFVSSCE